MQLHLLQHRETIPINWTPLFSSSLFASIHNQSPQLRSQKAAKVEHSLTHYDNVFFYIDISLRTTLKLRANGRNNFQQCWTMLRVVGQQSYVRLQRVKWYQFLVIHLWLKILAFCPAQPKWNQKLQCLRLRETNNPIIFIWEFPRPATNRTEMTSATV